MPLATVGGSDDVENDRVVTGNGLFQASVQSARPVTRYPNPPAGYSLFWEERCLGVPSGWEATAGAKLRDRDAQPSQKTTDISE